MPSILRLTLLVLQVRLASARRSERGASAVEWVVITALLVGIAGVIGAILLNTLRDGANGIELGID